MWLPIIPASGHRGYARNVGTHDIGRTRQPLMILMVRVIRIVLVCVSVTITGNGGATCRGAGSSSRTSRAPTSLPGSPLGRAADLKKDRSMRPR
jgi:hypothetical protein